MSKRKLAAVHPGEVLLEEFLKPLDLSQHQLGLDIIRRSCMDPVILIVDDDRETRDFIV